MKVTNYISDRLLKKMNPSRLRIISNIFICRNYLYNLPYEFNTFQ